MIMDDNEKFNKTIKKTNLRFSSNFVFWLEKVEVMDHLEHLYSFILIIIMLPLCSPVLIHYVYECEEDDKDYRWDDIGVIEDELKHKIDHMELIQLVVDIEVKHSIFKTCMLQVLFAEYCLLHRYAPIDAKWFIFDIYATISLGMIELIALVLEDGGFGEHGEAVSEAPRDEEL